MKTIFLLLSLLITTLSFSQYNKNSGTSNYRRQSKKNENGWYFGLGATYMLPYLKNEGSFSFTDSLNREIKENYSANPTGKFGLFAEIGKFKLTKKRFLNYIDYGIAYKWFRGGETLETVNYLNDTLINSQKVEGSYSDHRISLHLKFGYRFDKSEDLFFVNGLGLNADYTFIKSRSTGGFITNTEQKFVSDLVGEIHYFFGIGFRTGRVIIMPIIETPIFAAYEFNHIKSTHDYYNTRSRPIILRLRFMFVKKASEECPAVEANPFGIKYK